MKKIISLIFLSMVFINHSRGQYAPVNDITWPGQPAPIDTIVRTDTIVMQEVITRTDVIHRTETVVRLGESRSGYSQEYYSSGSPAPAPMSAIPPVQVQNNQTVPAPAPQQQVEAPIAPPPPAPINDISFERNDVALPQRDGGNYIWVPDSMQSKIDKVLAGQTIYDWRHGKKEKGEFDPFEKVTFRGDTLPMVLKDRNLGRYDRGLFNFLFIPKGIWQLGITASYGEFSTSDLEVLDLISDVDFNGKIFSVRPYVSYFLRNNISLGLRLGFTKGEANLGSFKVDIDEDMNFDLHDILYRSTDYSASILFTQYLGIARKGRFGVFNEVELALSGGNSDFHRPYNNELKQTHTTTFKAALNFSPGVCVYILEPLSFNVSLGVFGLYIQNQKQKVDGEELGHRTTSGANFRFNIFNINFGIAVNI